jgi:hypothetical protein
MFDDDVFGNEFDTKSVKSMKVSHFHVGELEQSVVLNSSDKDLQYESDPIIQLAGQDIRVNEAGLHDLIGETSDVVLKDLISEVAVSPNSEDDSGSFNGSSNSRLNVVNYDNEFADEDANSSGHSFYAVNDHEASWGLNQGCSLLDSYDPDDTFPSLLESVDILPSYAGLCDEFLPIDTLITMSAKCGVFPLFESATEASIVISHAHLRQTCALLTLRC